MSNIHYGINEEVSAAEFDDSSLKSEIATLKSDVATTKTDLSAEKLKVSLNKTAISVNKAAITSEKSKLTRTQTLVSNLSGQVNTVENNVATEKARITTNAGKISAVESKAETNRLGILNTITSIVNYHLQIADLANTYKTGDHIPNINWPIPLMQFGSVDTKTTFRLVGMTCDEDVLIPSANFSVTFLLKAYTAIGGISEAEVATLNLSTFQVPNKPFFCINRDYTLRSLFPTQNIKCEQLYIKHNMGARTITVESIITCAIVQF